MIEAIVCTDQLLSVGRAVFEVILSVRIRIAEDDKVISCEGLSFGIDNRLGRGEFTFCGLWV